MGVVIRFLVNALALWLADILLDGISLAAADSTAGELVVLGVVALVFTLVNLVVRPIVKFFSLPLYILTLGLFSFVVNALMLLLTGWLTQLTDYGLFVDGFGSALVGSIVISLLGWLANLVLPRR